MKKYPLSITDIIKSSKYLNVIVRGIICRRILAGDCYLDVKRLVNAINQYYVDRNIKIDKAILANTINTVINDLYIAHKIVPDSLHNKGFIISDNSSAATASINNFISIMNKPIRATALFSGCYGMPMLYSNETAKKLIETLDERTKVLTKHFADNYYDNYIDIYEVFTLGDNKSKTTKHN